jgi:glycerol-3-phosphate O-acyltransferase
MAEYGLARSPEAGGSRKLIAQDEDGLHTEAIGQILHKVVEEALRTFKAEDAIVVEEKSRDVQVISPVTEKRLLLDMYKNGIVNEFVPEAILSAGYLYLYQMARIGVDALREESRFLSRLFKLEFIYDPTKSFDELFDQSLEIMIDEEIFGRSDELLSLKNDGEDVLFYFSGIIGNLIEAYYTVIETVLNQDGPSPTKDVLKKSLTNAWKKAAKNQIVFPESVSMNYYKTALLWLTDEGYCTRSEDRSRVVEVKERDAMEELKDRLYKYMTKVVIPWRGKSRNA